MNAFTELSFEQKREVIKNQSALPPIGSILMREIQRLDLGNYPKSKRRAAFPFHFSVNLFFEMHICRFQIVTLKGNLKNIKILKKNHLIILLALILFG